ncbi:MAG: energy-coupled thiamine transporter ThiT [Lachnospiraceae bacterium]
MSKKFSARTIAFAAMALALAFVTSFIKIIDLPMGGSATLLSMFFVTLTGYWFGPVVGLISAFAYGALQLAVDPYILSVPQMICDYFLAFGALGLSGFFWKMKAKVAFGPFSVTNLHFGYLVAVTGRYVFVVLSGWIFFGIYAPDSFPNAFVYSLAYNGAYIGLEAGITLALLIFIPPLVKALEYIKDLATK